MARGVFAGDGERGGRDVGGRDVRVRQMVRERDGDGAGAGADVEDAEGSVTKKQIPPLRLRFRRRSCGMTTQIVLRSRQFGEDGFDEVLRLGTRDEDGGSDAEGESVELLLAGDVLDWFVGQAACDGGFVRGLLFCRNLALRIGIELRARDAERVQQQRERIACRGVAQIG